MTEHARRIRRIALAHHQEVVRAFHRTHKHAKRLFRKHRVVLHQVRHHSMKTAVVASISTGLLTMPALAVNSPAAHAEGDIQTTMIHADEAPALPTSLQVYGPSIEESNKQQLFKERITKAAPGVSHNLTTEQSEAVTKAIHDTFGITARTELDGIRLNESRGVMAGEQHLPLYPGDTVNNHFKNRFTHTVADPTANLTGMVPGLPSWGYFASSAKEVTKQDVDREQWYVAVQTFLSPGWQEHTQSMYAWFKYRKMIAINQETGQAVVVDIADAGPSPFLHRTFGGSNETLIALGLGSVRKGNVLMLFVDDPNDTIPLGPLTGYTP